MSMIQYTSFICIYSLFISWEIIFERMDKMKCDVLKENIELNDNKNTYYDNILE